MKNPSLFGVFFLLININMGIAQNPVYTSKTYSVYPDKIVQGKCTAKAVSATEITSDYQSSDPKIGQSTASSWKLSKDISAFPRYHSNYLLSDALYNLSIEEMEKAVEPDSTFRTGKEWSGVWTRDISYSIILSMAVLQPKVAMYSLMRKVKNGIVIQDTGTGGAYPVSSDRMIWAVAAWEIYKVTGDKDWLGKVYPIIKKSVAEDEVNVYDSLTGLVRGESSFLDWREQTYPRWMQPADIYESKCLGTNAVHYQVNKVLSEMSTAMNDFEAAKRYTNSANKIKKGIQQYLWLPEKGYYGQYLYGRNYNLLSPKSEALGEALSVLFDVADAERQKTVISHTPVNDFGIPCIYPQIPNIPPYHNSAVWPFVETYWAMASAKAGNEQSVIKAISAIYRPVALFLTNKENFVVGTGDYAGTQINSSNMLWSLSGNIALVYKVLFGMYYTETSLNFKPFIPKTLAGKRDLLNYKYRGAVLDIHLEGYGNQIKSVQLDGKQIVKASIPASLKGKHIIEIILANNNIDGKINLQPDYTSPETPVVQYQDGRLSWSKPVGADQFKLIKNGSVLQKTRLPNFRVSNLEYAEYQIIAVDANGVESFASEPVRVVPTGNQQIIQMKSFAKISELPYKGFSGTGFVKVSKTENTNININIPVKEAGVYAIDFRYANGNGPINTENKCALRTLLRQDKFLGTVVFPQRGKGDWSEWGFSNPIKVKLGKGNQPFSLLFKPANENMNGEINEAVIDCVRITKIGK